MSEILEKNLSFIRLYNPDLEQKIRNVNEYSQNFEINTNLQGEYNLLINGMPVHSITGAEDEAKNLVVNMSHNSPNSIYVIYGLGLGYLYDVFMQNTHGKIIVYEPNVELLRYVLDIVDFSVQFSENRSYFVSDIVQYKTIFNDIYRYKTKVSVSALDYHMKNCSLTYSEFSDNVKEIYGFTSHNFSFQINNYSLFMYSLVKNLDKRIMSPLLSYNNDKLKGKPALIVSAGPSLQTKIEVIKKYRDRFVIFCVGTALKNLLDNGIVPDFLNIIEKVDTHIHYDFPETKDINLICESYTNERVLEHNFKNIFITASEESDASRWLLDTRNEVRDHFETKGTVAYHSIFSAYKLGCNPIVLVGQDLAYVNGQCYAKGSRFENLKCEFDDELKKFVIIPDDYEKYRDTYFHACDSIEFKDEHIKKHLNDLNEHLSTVKGQKGEYLPTSRAYEFFVTYLCDFAKRYGNQVQLFNCSTGGAQIDGYTNIELEKLAEQFDDIREEKQKLLSEFCNVSKVDKSVVLQNLKNDVAFIRKTISLLEKGVPYVEKIQKELNYKKTYTDKARNYIDSAVNLFADITNNYLQKNKLLYMAGVKYYSEMNYLLREYSANYDYELVCKISAAISEFYITLKGCLSNMEKIITNSIQSLEEYK